MTHGLTRPQRGAFASGYLITLGVILALIGLVLVVGGVKLISVGGSAYYLLAGLGLIGSGVLIALKRMLGAWIYVGVFVVTALWALWEVGLAPWPLVPRVVAPMVLMALVVAAMPLLEPGRPGRLPTLATGGGLAAVLVVGIIAINIANPRPAPAMMPADTLASGGTDAGADWTAYGATYGARRYSTLNQITPQNVGQLKRVWVAHTRDLPSDKAKGKYGAETTPLKVGNRLYLCSAKNILIALDAATGKEIWRHDPQVSDNWIPYTAACRGVSYFTAPETASGEACANRIVEGTLDGRLIEVDAADGKPCSGFGDNGQVDIKVGMGKVHPGMVSMTAAPTIVRGVIVTGQQVLDGQDRWAPSGVIQGFDAVTGEPKWAWDMKQPDIGPAPKDGKTFSRGTPNMWTTASGDEALGLVYIPLGNSAADYFSGTRSPVENQYSSSLVAIDVTSGKPAWSFQTVHKDVWDYDLGSQATLIDYPSKTGPVPALVLPSKQGDLYILDRRTGQPLTGVEERRVPGGGVEPDQRSPTQPFSLFHNLRKADLTERSMWGMSPIDQMLCRIQFREASYKGFYTAPTTDRPWIEYPGYNGGSDWGGVAVDPVRGLIVANYNDMPNYNQLIPRKVVNEKGWIPRDQMKPGQLKGGPEGAGDPQVGVPYGIQVNAGWRMPFTGLLCKAPPYGGIRAIDIRTGKTLWDRPLGTARKNGPFGIPSMLPVNIGTPNNGGSVVTAGGLIFIAAATDDLIRAIDIRTGKTVWQDTLPAGGQATPMTYSVGGKQYLVIMAGGHHFMETPIGDELVAYALSPET
ncbi:MAG: membrane-bound PQQ-dependent dehydrogenase, glucose/quinate/shikimate family [Caulobacter sp.]|nr:membrane-bound PQQ-dependent dehydrogenase, glucose/quinate/shikimate family [Caulobacter sp.]